ncbi:MAG: hypothetical protein M3Z28_02215, partial [Candidatus Dormibacteraeota bacterium]|nr:hypothetical protein [Candidatus Dormibacteraeota bacterium]
MAAAYEPPVSDDRGELVIRPSWRAFGRWLTPIVLILIVGFALAEVFAQPEQTVAALGIVGPVFLLYLIRQALYMLGSRITVTADSILVTHMFRSTARVACRDIDRVVRLTRMGSMLTYSYVRPAVLAFSANGRCILSLHGERWAQA